MLSLEFAVLRWLPALVVEYADAPEPYTALCSAFGIFQSAPAIQTVSEVKPNAFAPIPATIAVVFAPTIFLTFGVAPLPIIGVNTDTKFWLVFMLCFDVPAVAFFVAHDKR